ncbi:MAG: hypothetical protein AABY95_08305 [Pseudomonadota bacterium]
MELFGSHWLRFQVAATILYVLLTFRFLKTKKQHWVLGGGMFLLLLVALVAPFAGLAQSTFWSFLLASLLLWAALFWYEGLLVNALQKNNPGAIAYLIPCMAWLFSVPLAVVIHFIIS